MPTMAPSASRQMRRHRTFGRRQRDIHRPNAAESVGGLTQPRWRARLARFMSGVFRVRAEFRERLAAVTHVDGTARLQVVDTDWGHFAGGPGTSPADIKVLDEALKELLAS